MKGSEVEASEVLGTASCSPKYFAPAAAEEEAPFASPRHRALAGAALAAFGVPILLPPRVPADISGSYRVLCSQAFAHDI